MTGQRKHRIPTGEWLWIALWTCLSPVLLAAEPAPAAAVAPPIEVNASQILITYEGRTDTKSHRSREEALALANRLATVLAQSPNRFGECVAEYSDGSKAEEGSVGSFRRGRMTPAFERTVFSLAVGEVAPEPVETPYGFHIIKRTAVPAVYAARFILISWDQVARRAGLTSTRSEADSQALAEKIAADVQAQPVTFREQMMLWSDDTLKHAGGLLPDFYPGRSDPALVAAIEKLPILGISLPIKTPYGFLILQRLELLRNRTPLQGFASARHLVVSYAGAEGIPRPKPDGSTGAPAPAPAGSSDADGGDLKQIQARDWRLARERARELVRMARADPGQFERLIRLKSDVADGPTGGDLGFVDLAHLAPALYEWGIALQNLKVGEISDPLETASGFDILMRTELPIRLRARQILVAWDRPGNPVKVVRSQTAAAGFARQYLDALKAIPPAELEKSFAAAADKYSDDNVNKGGDLGTFTPESYFPAVTAALLKMKIGEISDLLETPYGYVILLRLQPQNQLPEEKTPLTMPDFPAPRPSDPRRGLPPPR